MKQYNISQFEFSHAHLFFWDKVRNTNFSKQVRNHYELLDIVFTSTGLVLNYM